MQQYSQSQNVSEQPKQDTAMFTIYHDMKDQNERYYQMLSRLRSLGHRLKDTNVPEKETAPMKPDRHSGAVSDMLEQCDIFRLSNNQFDELLQKLEEII